MNKILLLLLVLAAPQLFAEDIESNSELVDPMIPVEKPSGEEIDLTLESDTGKVEEKQVKVKETGEDSVTELPPERAQEFAPVVAVPVATPVPISTIQVIDDDKFNPRKGHWLVSFGSEAMEYKIPLDFEGSKEQFEDEKRTLYGGRLGVGREFYLGAGFNTATKLEGFYMGTLFEKATNAGPEQEAEEFAYIKRTGHVYGGEATQSLGMIFDFHTKNPFLDEMTYMTLEPFVFAGIGRARAYNRLSYHWDTDVQEDYRARIQDSISSTSVGGGFNLTSSTGFFLYLKATQYQLHVTKRKEEGYRDTATAAQVNFNTTSTDVDTDPITIYAIGGGYKF